MAELCRASLAACCGEGLYRCVLEAGHPGPHFDQRGDETPVEW